MTVAAGWHESLQLGRAPEGAEGHHPPVVRHGQPASTGPRPGGRGGEHRPLRVGEQEAASTGPRPGGRGGSRWRQASSRWALALQLGRAPEGAEGRTPACSLCLERSASTGPRPGGRGGACTIIGTPRMHVQLQLGRAPEGAEGPAMWEPRVALITLLQLGRAPEGAEGSSRAAGRMGSRSFNWAAPRRARRVGPRLLGGAVRSGASTGPRPGGRGGVKNESSLA